jgi:hypothetical protein
MAMDLSGGLPVERDYVYAERPGPEVRDAVNFWLEEETGAFGMRIGVEAVAEEWGAHEIWLDIAFPDGRVLSSRERFPSLPPVDAAGKSSILGSGPLALHCVEPFRHWKATFSEHAVQALTAEQLIALQWPDQPQTSNVSFDIDIFPAVPPLVSGTLTAESRRMMSGEQGSFISPRFEQLCRVQGVLLVDGQRRDFKGQALRIKRQGVRKFAGFWGHCWMSALFPSGRAFGVNTFPPRADGKPTFNEGFVFGGDGVLKPARAIQIPWQRRLIVRGEDIPLVLETEDGQVAIEGKTFINCRSRGGNSNAWVPPEFPVVTQAHAWYSWQGEKATGMIERSTRRDEMEM